MTNDGPATADPGTVSPDAATEAGRPTVAVLGAGSMGEALLSGIVASGHPVSKITASVRGSRHAAELRERFGIVVYSQDDEPSANELAAVGAEVVLLGVKPHQVVELAAQIAPSLGRRPLADEGSGDAGRCVVVSVAAGVTIGRLEDELPGVAVVRVMPNTPSLIGQGMLALAGGASADAADLELARSVLAAAGRTMIVDESQLDAVTAVSGSGPAYFFYLAEALTVAAIELGLPEDAARTLVAQTAAGAGAMLRESPLSPAELRAKVTSPGGTTAAAIEVFDEADLTDLVSRAARAAARRSAELAG